MPDPDVFNFDDGDAAVRQKPVRYRGKDYLLREAPEKAAVEHQNGLFAALKPGPDGRPTVIGDMGDIEQKLVAACLVELIPSPVAGAPPKEGPVSLGLVNGMPSRAVKQLYQWVKSNSVLIDGAEDPLRESLKAALALPGAPCAYDALARFVAGTEGEPTRMARALLAEPDAAADAAGKG